VSTPNKVTESGSIEKFIIVSDYTDNLDISMGVVELHYYESMLDTTVRVSAKVVDSGLRKAAIQKKVGYEAALENDEVFEAPGDDNTTITGGEKVELSFSDNQGTTLSFPELRVQATRDISENSQFSTFTIDLFSKEAITNEYVDTRVVLRYEGKISDSVRKIITSNLQTPNEIEIDTTINEWVFNGNNEKPFYKLLGLATRSVPEDVPNALGNIAGYFFFETASEGGGKKYLFKSIDKLFSQGPKRTLTYTDTPGGTILDYSFMSTMDVKEKISNSAYSSSKLISHTPWNQEYKEDASTSKKQEENGILGGREFPKMAKDLDLPNKATNISKQILDTGTLPPGANLGAQLPKAKQVIFDTAQIMRQARQRYNQLFTNKLTVTIAGDFSLRAGDLVTVQFPEVDWETNGSISNLKSGIYMIVDVCHLIRTEDTFTKLNLIRDSVFKK